MGQCCTIVGEYAMYRAGKLASRPDSFALYIASPQTWSPEIAMLLQEQPSPTVALGGAEIKHILEMSLRGRLMLYIIRCGGEEIVLRLEFATSVPRCGLRSNIDLTCNVLTTFDFYCTYYAIVVLPSQTLDDKIVYVRHFMAEIGGETTRRCGRCLCMINDSLPYYDFGRRQPERCTCVLCCKQAPSLKSAASEIVFRCVIKKKCVWIL